MHKPRTRQKEERDFYFRVCASPPSTRELCKAESCTVCATKSNACSIAARVCVAVCGSRRTIFAQHIRTKVFVCVHDGPAFDKHTHGLLSNSSSSRDVTFDRSWRPGCFSLGRHNQRCCPPRFRMLRTSAHEDPHLHAARTGHVCSRRYVVRRAFSNCI